MDSPPLSFLHLSISETNGSLRSLAAHALYLTPFVQHRCHFLHVSADDSLLHCAPLLTPAPKPAALSESASVLTADRQGANVLPIALTLVLT